MPVSPVIAGQKLEELSKTLGDSGPLLAEVFSQEVLRRAKLRAATRPTPQAPIVASAAYARKGIVSINTRQRVGHLRTPAGKIAAGSEFGAERYKQFQAPHTMKGYWMYPARDDVNGDPVFLTKVDKSLETMLSGVESFGSSVQLFGQILRVIVAV